MNVAIKYTIEEIAGYTGGKLLHHNIAIVPPAYLSLDSRKILFPDSTFFFAINSTQRNGSDFVEHLYKKGVRNFLVKKGTIETNKVPQANVIVVDDTTDALQAFAAQHRINHNVMADGRNLPVIGITGSNGKTIVKEWLDQLLEKEFNIVRSPGSYNSQIGVPLSVLNINASNTLAIFEAGISAPAEMQHLEKIIKPTIGVVTNIGQAHDEGFKNSIEKINEKLKLFVHSDSLVFPGDDQILRGQVKKFRQKKSGQKKQLNLFSWGRSQDNELQILSISKVKDSAKINGLYKDQKYSIAIPFSDDASIENAITCWCVLILLDKNVADVIKRFSSLYPVAMRLELKQGINHCTIINDSYSNDLHSLTIALNFLSQQKQHAQHSVILSDVLQSGRKPNVLYAEIASLLLQKNITRFIGIGPELFSHQKEFAALRSTHFSLTVEDFLKSISPLHFHNENILIKGARIFGFEQIVKTLEQKEHQTVLSINLNAIVHNLKQYKQLLSPGTKIMGMVKAFSYGSGSYEIASVLEYNKVDYLAVAYTDEGVELRKAGIALPIMIMNVEKSTFSSLITHNLEPEIFSFGILNEFESFLKLNGINNYPVHLKIDTGMHRLGFTPVEIPSLAKQLSSSSLLKVMTVFTHLAASDDPNHDNFTRHQIKEFQVAASLLEKILAYKFYKHTANTSAISRHVQKNMDMVRLGIGLYGIDSNKSMQKKLQNVSTLTTTISQLKNVKAGETVGYGRNAILDRNSLVATVRIGYADGYPRSLGNGNGNMMLHGKLVPVVGNVCMDMTMLDVTDLQSAKEGDAVLVFGEALPLTTLAKWNETIPYEIMTGISQRVKRVYFEE